MYQAYYGFKEKPFSLTPDPHFLYLSENHRTALESLLYGIHQKEGFMVLTGDIGTGKTTLCRSLLERLDANVKTAVLFNSLLTEGELLKSILQDLGYPAKGRSRKERIDALSAALIDLLSQGKRVALIIDEAQNLSTPVLEQIRMLSNLETEKEKMLQIVLVGQIELEQKLQSPPLRQLNQRIAIRHRLEPLTPRETESYILQRLTIAGSNGSLMFSQSALREVYRFSKGVPRLINLVCDRALLAGFVDGTRAIHRGIVMKAERSLRGEESKPSISHLRTYITKWIPLKVFLILVFFLFLASFLLTGGTPLNGPKATKEAAGSHRDPLAARSTEEPRCSPTEGGTR